MIADGHELGNHAVYDEKMINLEEAELAKIRMRGYDLFI